MSKAKHSDFIPPGERPTVELVHPSYQPSKAELEAVIPPPDLTAEEAARALLRPVNIRYVRRPKRRG